MEFSSSDSDRLNGPMEPVVHLKPVVVAVSKIVRLMSQCFKPSIRFSPSSCEFLNPVRMLVGFLFLLGISQQECSTESHFDDQFLFLVWFKFINKMKS